MEIEMGKPSLGWRELSSVWRVLRSGQLAGGKETLRFEERIKRFQNQDQSVAAVNSGTSALHLGLLAMNLSEQDEVIVPAFTFAASANAVRLAGATPIFADVDVATMNLSAESVMEAVGPRTRAVIFVSLFGNMTGLREVRDLCERLNLTLIEDAAQSFGSTLDAKFSGTFGLWSAFSFYPTKNITTGEGGAVLSHDENFIEVVRQLRNQGMSKTYQYEIPGLNNRMPEISAAMGICQLEKADRFIRRRREIAQIYLTAFSSTDGIQVQFIEDSCNSSYNQFTIRLPGTRNRVMETLSKNGIGCRIYYPAPLTASKPYLNSRSTTPAASKLAVEVLSLPIHPRLGRAKIERVVELVLSSCH